MPSTATVTQPIVDQVALVNDPNQVFNLFSHFDDPFTTGRVARFELYNTAIGGSGVTNVVLYDQPGFGAPQSVQNFINYANDGDYDNSIIHRAVDGFVVQGGGFVLDGLATLSPPDAVTRVPADPAVVNEFSLARSNTRGTLAYAKLGGNPNSATNQWFFNLGDNSANLDNQNGGFTVFGEVISQADLNVIDAIDALPTLNNAVNTFQQGAFTDLPVSPVGGNSVNGDEDFVRYRSITVMQQPELTFSVIGNSNPALVNANVANNQLTLGYAPNAAGSSTITVRATNLQGASVEDSFVVNVEAFEADDYLASHRDLRLAFGYNLAAARDHYRQFGRNEQRSKDSFAEDLYLASNEDLINAFGYNLVAATQHYIEYGANEQRSKDGFNPAIYLSTNADVQAVLGQDLAAATRHYIEFGFQEGRDQLTGFDGGSYIASHADLISVFGYNPAAGSQHYLDFGFDEGRAVSFSPLDYLASHGDLINAFGGDAAAATRHYIEFGASEQRSTDSFNEVAYLNNYSDLQAAFGNNFAAATQHYIEFGFAEGRIA